MILFFRIQPDHFHLFAGVVPMVIKTGSRAALFLRRASGLRHPCHGEENVKEHPEVECQESSKERLPS
jgi:hypothetical protein